MELSPELLVQRSGTLVLLSATAEQVHRLGAVPECNITRAVRTIESDAALHQRLLALLNSPLFGFPATVTTVGRAVTILGPRDLCDLTVAAAVINTFKKLADRTEPQLRCWERALFGAVSARLIAEQRREQYLERFFVAGLLHDVGSVVLHLAIPNLHAQTVKLAQLRGIGLAAAENQLIGTNHAEVGAALARGWGLADHLAAAIGDHHQPLASRHPLEAAVTHVADRLAERALSETATVEPIDRKVWDTVAVAPSVLEKSRAEIHDRVAALQNCLQPQHQAA